MVYPRLWRVTGCSKLPCVLVLCALVSGGFLSGPAFAAGGQASDAAPSAAAAVSAQSGDESRLPASLPLKRDDDSDIGNGRVWMKEGLLLVVVLAGAAMVLIRKRTSSPASSIPRGMSQGWLNRRAFQADRPRVESITRLTNRASVHVLQWDGKEWLVGCTEQNMIVLGQRSSRSGQGDSPCETPLSGTVSCDGPAPAAGAP